MILTFNLKIGGLRKKERVRNYLFKLSKRAVASTSDLWVQMPENFRIELSPRSPLVHLKDGNLIGLRKAIALRKGAYKYIWDVIQHKDVITVSFLIRFKQTGYYVGNDSFQECLKDIKSLGFLDKGVVRHHPFTKNLLYQNSVITAGISFTFSQFAAIRLQSLSQLDQKKVHDQAYGSQSAWAIEVNLDDLTPTVGWCSNSEARDLLVGFFGVEEGQTEAFQQLKVFYEFINSEEGFDLTFCKSLYALRFVLFLEGLRKDHAFGHDLKDSAYCRIWFSGTSTNFTIRVIGSKANALEVRTKVIGFVSGFFGIEPNSIICTFQQEIPKDQA